MSLIDTKELNVLIMEPSAYAKNSMRILLQENHNMLCKGSVSSFKGLETFLSENTFIDVVFCEMYDHSSNIFEGILKLRQLVKKNPYVKFYLYTSVMCEKLQKQCYITDVYLKKISISECRFVLRNIAEKDNRLIKFPDLITVNNELSESELKVLISFSYYHNVTEVSINTGLNYKYVSTLKSKIMRKLGIRSNIEFKFMLAEVERSSYNLLNIR